MSQAYRDYKRQRVRERSAWVIGFVFLCLFMLSIGAIIAFFFIPDPDLLFFNRKEEPSTIRNVRISVPGGELLVQQNFVARIRTKTFGGFESVDLQIPWPYLPENYKERPENARDLSNHLLLTFYETGDAPSAEQRFYGFYRYYLLGVSDPGPAGLTSYRFKADSPYGDIQVMVGQLNGKKVFLRCDYHRSALGPRLCDRSISLAGGVSVRYRFAETNLADWKLIDATVRNFVNQTLHR